MINRRQKRKQWYDDHSKKILCNLTKINRIKYYAGQNEFKKNKEKRNKRIQSEIQNKKEFVLKAPNIFCVQKNPEGTIEYFNKIIQIREEYICDINMFIDISDVDFVGIDALMYLLAVIRDTKYCGKRKIIIQGNFPKNKNVKDIFIKSGFLHYVHTEKKDITSRSSEIDIKTGELNDPVIAGDVCKFVQEKGGFGRKETIPLYNILVELMGNTNQHAYSRDEDSDLPNSWYLYAEDASQDIVFVFLDTGYGIPATVRKGMTEKARAYFKATTDADFIISALNGEYRSETKLRNRGKGLPQISEGCRSGLFKDVSIYAGKGNCYIDSNNEFCKCDLPVNMRGTLFTWRIKKRRFYK